MSSNDQTGRSCLFPAGVQQMQLYNSFEILGEDVDRCAALGWEVIDLDASGWSDPEAVHDQLSETLGFPSYYGRNLDALDDAMAGLAEGRYGFSADAAGGVIRITGFDRFVVQLPRQAEAFTEILFDTTCRALRFGWPLVCFLQSDNSRLRLTDVPQAAVQWNSRERQRNAPDAK